MYNVIPQSNIKGISQKLVRKDVKKEDSNNLYEIMSFYRRIEKNCEFS